MGQRFQRGIRGCRGVALSLPSQVKIPQAIIQTINVCVWYDNNIKEHNRENKNCYEIWDFKLE